MKRTLAASFLVVGLVGVAAAAYAQEKPDPGMKTSVVAQTPEWQKISSLVGDWEGTAEFDGKPMPTTAEMRMTGDKSAVMHVLDKSGPHEMVTMIHPDGKRLIATHYCAAHNQPRMALVPSKGANQIAFEFFDGTNIAPGDTYMKGLVITVHDADRHDEAWTSVAGGKESTVVFRYTRKK